MSLRPFGLPAALNAWNERGPDPVATIVCAAEAGCDTVVGKVYRTPRGVVVESWTSSPEAGFAPPPPTITLEQLDAAMDVTALLSGFSSPLAPMAGEDDIQVQIDILNTPMYWQRPSPLCPTHGQLEIDRAVLSTLVRQGGDRYEAKPST